MNFFDDYEIFISDFISFKKKIKNDPKKIELYLRNTNKYDNHKGMLILLYRYKTLENKLINTDEKFLSDLPDKFNEEWNDFDKNYKYELMRVGTEVIDSYIEKIDGILEKKTSYIMTKNPKTVDENIFAIEALNIMKKNKITQVFVTKNNKPIGILHIHDCIELELA